MDIAKVQQETDNSLGHQNHSGCLRVGKNVDFLTGQATISSNSGEGVEEQLFQESQGVEEHADAARLLQLSDIAAQ